MRVFIDECLSPALAAKLNDSGEHLAEHPLHYGLRGRPDYEVFARCFANDLTLVTENARDFRALIGATKIHPGLIILPSLTRAAPCSTPRLSI